MGGTARARLIAGLALAGAVLAGCGSDPTEPGAFEAQSLAVLPGGALLVGGITGACDDVVLRVFEPGGASTETRIDGADLGGDCAARVTGITAGEAGNDVLVELRDETRGVLESDVLTPTSLIRVDDSGSPVEGFGNDGLVEDVGAAVASLPDGALVTADGTRYTPEGSEVGGEEPSTESLEPELVPGEARIAAAPEGWLLRAGAPRDFAARGSMLVARYGPGLELDPRFGRGGVAELVGAGSPAQLVPAPDGGAFALGYGGGVVRVDGRGEIDRAYGRDGVAATFSSTLAGTVNRMVERDGELTLMRFGEGAPELLRLDREGRVDRGFDPRLEGEGSVDVTEIAGDLALDAAGNAVVLTDVQDASVGGSAPAEIAAYDADGDPAPLPGGTERIVLGD